MKEKKTRYYGILLILIILAMTNTVSASGEDSLYVTTLTESGNHLITPGNVVNNIFAITDDIAVNRVEIHGINGVPSFDPADITILQGTTVNWTNNDSGTGHTVTSDTGVFNSGILDPGQSFVWTFNDTGIFAYHCEIHSFMHGNVTVISTINTYNISGYKINDINGNGIWNNNEPGIPNWNISLKNATTGLEITNTTTNNNGLYNFNNVTNGTYIVAEELKSGWINISALSRQVIVSGHDVLRQDFNNQINDTIPPVVNSVVLDNYAPNVGEDILVTVNATDNVGVANVAIDNIDLVQDTDDLNRWFGTIIAEEGNHSVNVSAKDIRGNVAWNNSTTYTGMNSSIRFVLTVDRPTIAVNQSQNALYILTINNTGQVDDTYNLTIDNPNNANVSISQRNISIGSGNSSTLNLTVNSSIPGIYPVNVTATSRTNPLLNIIVSTRTKVLSPSYIRTFSAGNGSRAGKIVANATVTNLGNVTHWFVVVASGVNTITGYPLVGTGTVRLDANQTIRVPILITIPPSADIGEYQLFAGIYPFDEEVLDPDTLIGTIQGPVISTVN